MYFNEDGAIISNSFVLKDQLAVVQIYVQVSVESLRILTALTSPLQLKPLFKLRSLQLCKTTLLQSILNLLC